MDRLKKTIVCWYYRTDSTDISQIDTEARVDSEWQPYRDFEIDIIEESYQQGESYVILDHYRIDLVKYTQIRVDNGQEEKLIKREIIQREPRSFRVNRFGTVPHVTSARKSSLSADSFDPWCPFLRLWLDSPAGQKAWYHLPTCVEFCVKGIIEEANQYSHNSKSEGAYIARKIRECSLKPRSKISELCIHFYTKNSFLYDALNRAMRECDHSKLETLGPLAFLISSYSKIAPLTTGTVYRGAFLTDADIDGYRQWTGTWRSWPACTSTSKNRQTAELFGNTLFVIKIFDVSLGPRHSIDISHLSQFPSEEEVLMLPGASFFINDVYMNSQNKWIIDVKL